MDTEHPDQLPQFSRTGFVGPHGPLICEHKTRVDIDLDLAFRRMCAEAGTDSASVLRNWINQAVRGTTYDEDCFHAAQSRAEKLGLKGPNAGLKLVVRDVPQRDAGRTA